MLKKINEINIRIWVPHFKEMLYFDSIIDATDDNRFYLDDNIIMYQVDLSDKKGDQIWECDIVKCLKDSCKINPVYVNSPVFFENGSYRITEVVGGMVPTNILCGRKDIEKIGNIFENPDLLK